MRSGNGWRWWWPVAEPWVLVEPGSLVAGGTVPLPPEEARHLRKVLRRGGGDRVILFDGAGGVADGVLRPVGRDGMEADLAGVRQVPEPPPGPEPSVAVGVLHGQAMDWAVQKAVELGVPRFLPVLCRRSQPGRGAAEGRLGHWRRVARQALKQCHRPWAMEVEAVLSLEELIERVTAGSGIVADREGVAAHEVDLERPVVLLVGPEGGLTPAERRLLSDAGWQGLRLGEYVLRAETAVVAGTVVLSACQAKGGE